MPLTASTSPSPVKAPPMIRTVAPAILTLSGSTTRAEPASVRLWPSVNETLGGMLLSAGGVLMVEMSIVVVEVVLVVAPSLTTQVTVRVRLEPKSLGLSPAAKPTESSTDWKVAIGSGPVSVSVSVAES